MISMCVVLPVFAITSLQQGVTFYRAGNYEKAIYFFSQGKTAEDYYNLGNTHAKMQQYELALKAYDNALRLKPNFSEAVFNRKLIAELYYQQLVWLLSVQHFIDDPSGFLYNRFNSLICAN